MGFARVWMMAAAGAIVWSAAAGPVHLCPSEGDLVVADPLFCDPEAGDFRLCSSSVALQGETPLGAFGEGCSECPSVVAKRKSIGTFKGRFRRSPN